MVRAVVEADAVARFCDFRRRHGRDLRRQREHAARGVKVVDDVRGGGRGPVVAAQSARMMRGHICVLNLAPIAWGSSPRRACRHLGVTTYNLLPGGVFERGSARLAQVVRIMS